MPDEPESRDENSRTTLKIRLPNTIFIIDILVLLLILSIVLLPASAARIILGVPFLLFFPGYLLVAALFPGKPGMDGLERAALSFGISIAVVAAIGLALNYLPWGINLVPVLIAVSAFVLVASAVALMRQPELLQQKMMTVTIPLSPPGWSANRSTRLLYLSLLASMIITLAVFIYTVTTPRPEDLFTEYYLLGANQKMQDYPVDFTMRGDKVVSVIYDGGAGEVTGEWGRVILKIVNHEGKEASYLVRTTIDGEPASVHSAGDYVEQLGPVALPAGESWQAEIGIAPRHTGNNQKVEFLLYINDQSDPYQKLHLWINAGE